VRAPISREQIVHQALALLDDVGFDGLTMRKLGERLGIQAASLYNHVHDKQELLALLADAICGEFRVPESVHGWRAGLEALGWEYRRVLLAHRDAARVLASTPPVGPRRWALMEQLLSVLRMGGFSDVDIVDASWMCNSFVVGFVLDETQGAPGGEQDEQVWAQVGQWFRSLPAERYPVLVSLAGQMVEGDVKRRFGFGLRVLLDGLEARLNNR
jgi:AcrR family transcriptional regulator